MIQYNKERPLRVFTAFSGYDSQCLALDRLKETFPEFEYELVGWSEIDKYAIQAHNALYPQWAYRNYGDISKIDWNQVPDFDLFIYSSPCQDFSVAGLQKGGDEGSGTRSSLLWECRKAIEIKRPRFALLENVKALVSKKFYPLFMDWVSTLVSLGYYNWWQVLNSTDYENPQNRERVFLVSCLGKIQYQFPEPKELPYCVADILDYDSINQYRINRQTEREFIESLDMERLEKEARFADERGLTVDESEIDDEDV